MSIITVVYFEIITLMLACETLIIDETLLEYVLILFVTLFLANEWQIGFQEAAIRKQRLLLTIYEAAHKQLLLLIKD